MSVERIDSLFNTPQIQEEFAVVKSGLADSQKDLVGLFNTIKGFKDTTITNLASNTEKLSTAITGSVQATAKAKTAYDNLTSSISAQVKAANENATAVSQNSQSYDKLIQQAVRNKISLDDLSASQKALKTVFQAGTITFEDYQSGLADITEAQLRLKTSNSDVTKTLNNLEKQAQASGGSLNEMRATLNLLVQSYDKLSVAEQQSAGGQSLQKTIQSTNAALTQLEVSTGRNQRKVGDYTGALKILETGLAEVNSRLAQMTAAGQQNTEAFAAATVEQERLSAIVGQQEKGFSSATMQIRNLERGLFSLKDTIFGASEGFSQLRNVTTEAAQAQKEFQREQKLLESQAPVLGAITIAARGLAGAYAIGQGAASLFADDNEKLAKDLNKMIAIMTILQGLNEAYKLINESGAISQAIKNGFIKAANYVQGENAAITKAQTAANIELAASQAPVIAETEGQTLAMGELAVAAEGAAAAETEVAAATVAARTALIATGIGAAVALLAVGVIYLLSKIPDWIKGNEMTIKQQEELAEAVKDANEQLISQAKLFTDNDDVSKKYYEGQLALSQAAGNNEEKNFAIKKAITAQEKELAQNQIDMLGATNGSQIALKNSLIDLNLQKQEAIQINKDLLNTPDQDLPSELKDQKAAAVANVKFYQDKIDAAKGLYEAGKKAREDLFAANLKADKDDEEELKFTNDERRKIILESANLEADYIKNKNAIILGDEKSTLEQRLRATQSNAEQERRLIEANKNNVLSDPGSSSADKSIAIKKAAEEQMKVTANLNLDKEKLTEQFYQRERDAALAAARQLLEDDIKNNDVILAHDKARLQERLSLQFKNYEDQRAILGSQLLRDLDDPALKALDDKKQNEARLAIQGKYQSDLLSLNIDYAKKQEDEQKKERERQLKDAADAADIRKNNISKAGDTALIALDQSTNPKSLDGVESYNRKRKEIEFNTTQDILLNQITADYASVNSYKQGTKERSDAEAKLSDDVKAFADNNFKHASEKQQELANAELALGNQTADLIKSAVNDRYENELNHIQKVIEANDKLKAADIERINSSTLSEQEKANAIIILNARVDAQNNLLAQKAKKLKHDEAVSDKALNVAKAIEAGILAVLRTLPDIPLSIIVGATAAAEIAEIIATPIPAYKTGTENHPGGLARVHRDELIIEPGKTPYKSPGDDVIMDLAQHARVIPAQKIKDMTEAGMFVNHRGRLIQANDNEAAKEMRAMKDALVWQTQRLETALKAQKKITVIHNHISNDFIEHITKSVYT